MQDHTLETSGSDDEPYWDDSVLAQNERENGRAEHYMVVFTTEKNKSYTVETDYDVWESLKVGEGADIVVKNGSVREINGRPVK